MNFWHRLRFYLIGVTLGLIISFAFFKNRGCSWTPENRVLSRLSSSMILRTDSAQCLMQCRNISDEDIFLLIKKGNVLFSESQTKTEPKKYILEGTTKKDGSQFKLAFTLYDSTAVVEPVNTTGCSCDNKDNSLAKILVMPEKMTRELFLSKEISATSHSDCQIKCLGLEGAEIRKMIIDGEIDYERSTPRSHPHPIYTVNADSVSLQLEITEKKTRVLNISHWQRSCECGNQD